MMVRLHKGALVNDPNRSEVMRMEEDYIPMRLSIDETLRKKNSDFSNWTRRISTQIIPNGCPHCGADLVCAHADMGTTDFCDTYQHTCMNSACDFLVKKEEFGIGMGERDVRGPSACPICGRTVQ